MKRCYHRLPNWHKENFSLLKFKTFSFSFFRPDFRSFSFHHFKIFLFYNFFFITFAFFLFFFLAAILKGVRRKMNGGWGEEDFHHQHHANLVNTKGKMNESQNDCKHGTLTVSSISKQKIIPS